MRKLFFVWALLTASLLCYAATNGSVSEKEKERIKAEVKEVINTLITGCEQANFEMTCGTFHDSPDFKYIYNGNIFGYKDLVNAMQPLFKTMTSQKFTFFNEYYNILDRATVLYTAKCKTIAYFKDGHSTVSDPGAAQFILKKIGIEWKIIYAVESTVEKDIEKQQTEKLNQVELFKKYVTGMWKCKTGKDTIFVWNSTTNKNELEAESWYENNGKRFWESKSIIVYDQNSDKYIWTRIFKKGDTQVFAWWFTSPDKIEAVPVNNITNPANATFRIKFEYLSADSLKQTITINNKVVDIFNIGRIKERMQEQSSQKNLNQAELLRKYIGTWKAEVGKDTTNWFEFAAYGENALAGSFMMKVKDKVIFQNKQLWGYDNRSKKIIGVELGRYSGMMIFYLCGFISENLLEGVAVMDINHPENVTDKFHEEFKSPDMYIQSYIENNKKISIKYTRVKTGK